MTIKSKISDTISITSNIEVIQPLVLKW